MNTDKHGFFFLHPCASVSIRGFFPALLCLAFSFSARNTVEAAVSNQSQPCAIHWRADHREASKSAVEVSGLSAPMLRELRNAQWDLPHWQRLLSVYAEQRELATNQLLPAIFGAYRVTEDMLH